MAEIAVGLIDSLGIIGRFLSELPFDALPQDFLLGSPSPLLQEIVGDPDVVFFQSRLKGGRHFPVVFNRSPGHIENNQVNRTHKNSLASFAFGFLLLLGRANALSNYTQELNLF
jgi:hypothetical protein